MADAGSATSVSVTPSRFNDGTSTEVPPIINGCWTLAGGHGQTVFQTIPDAFKTHAAAGLTAFDTADIYGKSEAVLGVLQQEWAAGGGRQVQLFTKYVPNIFQSRPTAASVRAAVQRSLSALQVEQLDLVQLHWWDYGIPGMVDVGLWLTELKQEGLIGSVGATNLNVAALSQLVDAGVPIVCNQVQFSLLDRRPLNGMVQYCSPRGIKLLTYGSLAGGLLSDRYVEEPKRGLLGGVRYNPLDLNTSSLKMYWNTVQRAGGEGFWRELLAALRRVADRHGCNVANVALRWCMDQGPVHPIVGLRTSANLEDNLRSLTLQLVAEDYAEIDGVLAKAAGPDGDCYSFERGE